MLWITVIISFVLSLGSKFLVDQFLAGRIPILGNVLGLQLTHNAGVAFSMTFPPLIQTSLIAIAVVCVAIFALRSSKTALSQVGFGLILGGAFANIIDRIPDGLVTDFIQVGTFPIFNVADSCITVGVAVLLIEAVFKGNYLKDK